MQRNIIASLPYQSNRVIIRSRVNDGTVSWSIKEAGSKILLHKAAKNAFDELQVKKLPKVKELNAEYAKVLVEKKKLYGEYRQAKKDMQEVQRAKQRFLYKKALLATLRRRALTPSKMVPREERGGL